MSELRWHLCPGAHRQHLLRNAAAASTGIEAAEGRQKAAGILLTDLTPQSGVGWFPVVWGSSEAPGFLARVVVPAAPFSRPLNPEEASKVKRWVVALVPAADPELLGTASFGVEGIPEDVPLHGASFGLAAAVALISHLLVRPPLRGVLTSAELDVMGAPGALAPVKELSTKALIVAVEAPGVEARLASSPQNAGEWLSEWMGTSWRGDLALRLEGDAHSWGRESWEHLKRGEYSQAQERSNAALATGQGGLDGALARWTEGALLLHEARPMEALERLREARGGVKEVANGGQLRWLPQELEAWFATALLDLGRPKEAGKVAGEALEFLLSNPDRGDERFHQVLPQVAGALAKALSFAGLSAESEKVYREISLNEAHRLQERARTWGDLAELLRRRGDVLGARRALEEASPFLRKIPAAERPLTHRFHRIYRVRVEMETPAWPVVPPHRVGEWPHLAEVMETLLAGPEEVLDEWMEEGITGKRTLVQGLALAGVAARVVQFQRRVPLWLPPLLEPLLAEPTVEEEVRAALHSLGQGHPTPWLRIAPY